MTRSFDCPKTGTACQNDECGAMHCMTQIEERAKPRPFRLSAMETTAGWVGHDGGRRPDVPLFYLVQTRQRRGGSSIASVSDIRWEHSSSTSRHAANDVMAYRFLVPGYPALPIPEGWTPWLPTSGMRSNPHPAGSKGDVLCLGTLQNVPTPTAYRIHEGAWLNDWSWGQTGSMNDIIAYRNVHVPTVELPAGEEGWVRFEYVDAPPVPRDTIVDVLHINGVRTNQVQVQAISWNASNGSRIAAYKVIQMAKTPEEKGFTKHTPGRCPVPEGYTGKVIVTTADGTEHPAAPSTWKGWPWDGPAIRYWKMADAYTPILPHMTPAPVPTATPVDGDWVPYTGRAAGAAYPDDLAAMDTVNIRVRGMADSGLNRAVSSVNWNASSITHYRVVRRATPAALPVSHPGWTEWNGADVVSGTHPLGVSPNTTVDVMFFSGVQSDGQRAAYWNWRWGTVTPAPGCIVRWRLHQAQDEWVAEPIPSVAVPIPGPEGWIDWDFSSEEGPAHLSEDDVVEVRLRDNSQRMRGPGPVGDWRWDNDDDDTDIVAYRLAPAAPAVNATPGFQLTPIQILEGWVARPIPSSRYPEELEHDTMVVVMLQNGQIQSASIAGAWTWSAIGEYTIVAYRRTNASTRAQELRRAVAEEARIIPPSMTIRAPVAWVDRALTDQSPPYDPDTTVEIETRSGITDEGSVEGFIWTQDGDGPDIIRYRRTQ